MVLIGKRFPSIDLKTIDHRGVEYKFNIIDEVNKGKKIVLFWYPKNFTSVCPTELIAFQDKIEEFNKRNCLVVAASCDTCESHKTWLTIPQINGGIQGITYPVISDSKRELSSILGILDDEDNVTYRATYLIDEKGIVFHESVNDMSIGRNIEDFLRILDSKIYNQKTGQICEANWKYRPTDVQVNYA
jgi:peroxiredoxin (alkyl hydroperoxide reductase subunit C)